MDGHSFGAHGADSGAGRTSTPRPWLRRIRGLFYVGGGLVCLLFALCTISASFHVDDYYYVPHACECLECLHGMKTYPDGNTYCAKFPPKHIKMAEVSSAWVGFSQVMVGVCGTAAVAGALGTLIFGFQWLLAPRLVCRQRWYRIGALSAPALALALPFIALFFCFPYGIVPM